MEKKYVPSGVCVLCDKGTFPGLFTVTSNLTTEIYGVNLATEADKAPLVNLTPMGVCAVTHIPCIPQPLPTGWSPVQNSVIIGGQRLLLEDSKLRCAAGGQISLKFMAPPALPSPPGVLDAIDAKLAELGPLGDPLRFQMGVAEGVAGGVVSLAEGLWSLGKLAVKAETSYLHALTHPVETAQSAWKGATAAADWASKGENWNNAWEASQAALGKADQAMSDAHDWVADGGIQKWASEQSPRDWGKLGGRGAFEVAMLVGTAGTGEAVNAAAKAGEAVNLAEKGLEVANLAEKGAEVANAAGKLKLSGPVVTGAEEAAEAARAAKVAEEAAAAEKAAKEAEAVSGCAERGKCTEVGHPVDVSNGMVFTQQTDFSLPGPVPVVWERTWYSRSVRRGPLGHGWHHAYDMGLVVEDNGSLALRLADGRLAQFEAPAFEGKSFNRREKLEAERTASGHYRVWDVRRRVWYAFAPHPAHLHQVLVAVEDANGFAVRLYYSATGQLHTLTDTAARRLDFISDAQGRLVSVSGPDPDLADSRLTLVQYQYDEAGNLTAAIDALGNAIRFCYEGHLLVQETNRVGLNFYFTYDGTDHTARCRRTWGDGGIYDTKLSYPAPDLTVVTDSLGAVTHYTHEQGLATVIVDALGGVTQRVYNADGELELERDPLGAATVYDYNARGAVTQVTGPDGAAVQYAYNALDLPAQITDANGNNWQWQYDEAGNMLEAVNPLGAVTTYRYEQGLLTELSNAAEQRTQFSYDAQHNLRHVVSAEGSIVSRQYDLLGQLVEITDAAGAVQRYRYNALGQLVSQRMPDGTEGRFQYDGEGNLVFASDQRQEVTLEYTGQGQLARRQQAGTDVRFYYDLEGRLIGLDNEHREAYRFGLDALGQVVTEQGFDGILRRYRRDAAGRVRQVERPAGRSTHYDYDAAGRLREVLHPDEAPIRYSYDATGALVAASNANSTIELERDALGQVVRETQGGVTVESTYNPLGQRTALGSSLGAALQLAYNPSGSVRSMQAGAWSSQLVCDAQGLELHRAMSGGVQVTWQRDALGRPMSQRIAAGGGAGRQRRYQWQGADQLLELDDSQLGTTRFGYDARGYLTQAHYADGTEDLRQADAVGNLFRSAGRTDRQYAPGGQLRQAQGTRYRYDAEGNLVRKTRPDGQTWHYAWDGAGQLTRVTRPDGYAVSFGYDALGRRVSKRFRGRTTHWVWDGDKPLHEWHTLEVGPETGSAADLTTWLFEEHSFAPVAKLTAQGRYSVVADHLGTPLELYDQAGRKTWQAQLDSYGAVRQGQGQAQDCPFRYQGQYEDTETGLYYNRFRYYDPEAGCYISQDPIGIWGGLPIYGYVSNTSSWIDKLGLSSTPTNPFDIVNYGAKTSPLENHHGILDVWAKHNVPDYTSRASHNPTIALTQDQHTATKSVYRDWLEARTGKRVGGKVDWKTVPESEARALSERMFDAASVPQQARDNYYKKFNEYVANGCGK